MKIEKILFPTDFSLKSVKAREHAIYFAGLVDAPVFILHAIEPFDYDEMDDEIMGFYRELEMQLKDKMDKEKEIFKSSGISIHDDIVIGRRWRVINTYASEHGIDLIVMGSHGVTTETGELSVGTTSHRVMFTSPCPILLVRHEGN